MEKKDLAILFVNKVQNDIAIDTKHIALYMAILFKCINAQKEKIVVDRSELMRLSKISSTATYYRKMAILNHYGYIGYYPSQANDMPTTVELKQL
ncbi:hypothetical protein [Sphingobacterium sp. UGAL515B_05]|uniref:hypothetical protein n=1 Tax=Sphingobacterium sp. UGAL515B_05 TaxID=2986767 RepID=UPI002952B068|nr:hypothetical protein [Sphingobacterium sp. UGAL515B_05]WON93753.1 hypothetical protein OK025_21200 [Sphingobacterium sp. UGAL515B_05]